MTATIETGAARTAFQPGDRVQCVGVYVGPDIEIDYRDTALVRFDGDGDDTQIFVDAIRPEPTPAAQLRAAAEITEKLGWHSVPGMLRSGVAMLEAEAAAAAAPKPSPTLREAVEKFIRDGRSEMDWDEVVRALAREVPQS